MYLFSDAFSVIFALGFIIILGAFVVIFVKGIAQWNKNNHSPKITVDAVVVSKRTNVSDYNHSAANNVMHTSRSTTYYATFQVESGDRIELRMSGAEYGMLVEHDTGKLTFQGTRYLGFQRDRIDFSI